MLNVGLLGLGTMGSGMADVLLRSGFPLAVYNRNPDRAEPFRSRGATISATPKEAAQNRDVVIAMVADDGASRQVWTAENGALAGCQSGSVLIECSTISPGWAKELAQLAMQQGCGFLDAPVTGSKAQAGSGGLKFLTGGDKVHIARAEPVLRVLAKEIIPLGPVGSGALMKLINNMVCGVQVASIGEAINLIERSGLNVEQAVKVLTGGAPGSPLVNAVSSRMIARDDDLHFAARLMQKDLTYALAEGESRGLNLATVAAALNVFRQTIHQGLGDADISAVAEMLRGTSGH